MDDLMTADATVVRSALLDRLDAASRAVLLVAPSGYGKTTLARQWVEQRARSAAWLTVEPPDSDPLVFWSRTVRAIRSLLPDLDDEPELALTEDPRGGRFLSVLIAAVLRSEHRGVLVLDDTSELTEPSIVAGLVRLVDAVGTRLRFLFAARSTPAFPLARWRSEQWLTQLDERDLRLTDDEAVEVAAATGGVVGPGRARAINRHVDGWPIAFRLALVSVSVSETDRDAILSLAGDRDGIALLVGQILDHLDEDVRAGALALSVAGTFDAEMAQELIDLQSGKVVAELQRHRLVVAVPERGGQQLRFPAVFRDVLERDLRWSDPVRFEDLHRRAAKIHQRRHDFGEAYEHLMAVGDVAAAEELVILPTLQFVDRGDRAGLAQMLTTVRSPMRVESPGLALDLAMASFFAGSGIDAALWCDRAEQLGARDGGSVELRLHSTRGILALMNGQLDAAGELVDAYVALERTVTVDGPMVQRFATVAARLALVRRDLGGSATWLERARLIADPPTVAKVTVPGLHAWFDLMVGRLDRAHRLLGTALGHVEEMGMRPHQGVFDVLVTAAWLHFVEGDLAVAMEHADAAMSDAEELGYDWNRVRAAVITARIRHVTDGPSAAAAVIRDARARIVHTATPLTRQLDRVDALTRARRGDLVAAEALLDHEDDSPPGRLARAGVALAAGRMEDVEGLVADDGAWLPAERIEGRILRAAADGGEGGVRMMRAALEEAAEIGIVAPFLGQDDRVAALVLHPSLDRVHPRVTALLRPVAAPAARTRRQVDPLTARELSILELLPTHLSYAQIGEELYVSVNTVKSNVKSVYRKLGAATRSDAVSAARAAGLI